MQNSKPLRIKVEYHANENPLKNSEKEHMLVKG